jgi:hypothetical protein
MYSLLLIFLECNFILNLLRYFLKKKSSNVIRKTFDYAFQIINFRSSCDGLSQVKFYFVLDFFSIIIKAKAIKKF